MTEFRFGLSAIPHPNGLVRLEIANDEVSQIGNVLLEVCTKLSPFLQFQVSGFDLDWPVEIDFDLWDFLKGITEGMPRFHNGEDFEILFSEQYLQRQLIFKPQNDYLEVSCLDMLSSDNAVRKELRLEKSTFVSDVTNVVEVLASCSKQKIINFDEFPLLSHWFKHVVGRRAE
jgi:hypothetical protein